jgi:hypothetical protein
MAIRLLRSREFRRCVEALPEDVQALADESFMLWKRDPAHPSLHFKKVSGENWSARVGIHYRAIGHFVKDGFLSGNGLVLMASTTG